MLIFYKKVLEILLPTYCIGCKKKNEAICELCLSKIRTAEREPARHISAVFDYRDSLIKKIVWELKYNNKKLYAEILGQKMYHEMLEEISDLNLFSRGSPILVIPVPLSKPRLKKRGYNQSVLIAQAMVNMSSPKIMTIEDNIIIKTKDTPPQARIVKRNKRLENIKGAFSFRNIEAENFIKGRTIIILDDVTTTGGTIHEIMKLLESAGAKKVVGLALAH
jgi:competence protein ComFC